MCSLSRWGETTSSGGLRSIWQEMSLWSSESLLMTWASVGAVMVLVIIGAVVFRDSIELILSPGVGVPTLGARTTVGCRAEAGELITILGVGLWRPLGDGRGISDRHWRSWVSRPWAEDGVLPPDGELESLAPLGGGCSRPPGWPGKADWYRLWLGPVGEPGTPGRKTESLDELLLAGETGGVRLMTPLGEGGGVCVITLCLPCSWWRSKPRSCSWGASGSSPKLVSREAMAPAKCLTLACSEAADPRDEEVSDADRSVLVSNLAGDRDRF